MRTAAGGFVPPCRAAPGEGCSAPGLAVAGCGLVFKNFKIFTFGGECALLDVFSVLRGALSGALMCPEDCRF